MWPARMKYYSFRLVLNVGTIAFPLFMCSTPGTPGLVIA
jgi:hypothetical protein